MADQFQSGRCKHIEPKDKEAKRALLAKESNETSDNPTNGGNPSSPDKSSASIEDLQKQMTEMARTLICYDAIREL